MEVLFHPEVEAELTLLPEPERAATDHAFEKLEALGASLPYPHQSDVRGAKGVRELRPRGGRSRWRAFYRRIGEAMVIGAVGPEADVDRRGFQRAVHLATRRLDSLETSMEEERR